LVRRREFFTLFSSVGVAWTVAGRAQAPSLPVVGFMSSRSPNESTSHVAAFRQGLTDVGYADGRNVAIEYRWARGRYERLPALASELVGRRVAVLASVGGAPSALAAKRETATIPIVFVIGDDPVRLGLVASFNRPGGNVTGVSFFTNELGAKRLGLINGLVPKTGPVALLLNRNDPGAEVQRQDVQTAAQALGRRLVVLSASAESELTAIFARLVHEQVAALVVQNDPFLDSQRDRLIALADLNAVPAIYHIREFPAAGGLMSYGASLADSYRQVGVYTGRILNGEKPAELPVLRPTKFDLVINLKTAKTMGLAIPQSLLLLADEVIR
jgi:putative ABC transport system substrate-binding protein